MAKEHFLIKIKMPIMKANGLKGNLTEMASIRKKNSSIRGSFKKVNSMVMENWNIAKKHRIIGLNIMENL